MTLAEMLRHVLEYRAQTLHVSLPGIIESYDAAKQRASVRLAVQWRMHVQGDQAELQPPELLPSVPVMFPRGGGAFITWPLAKGDQVLVVFQDRSIDRWTAMGGVVDPIDPRSHHLSDAVCLPGFYPYPQALPSTDPDAIVLGVEGQPVDFVALAGKVLEELEEIRSKFNAHTHAVTTTGTAAAQSGTAAAPAGKILPIGSVAASKVKAS